MPVTPHLVSGKVYDLYSVALADATVTLKHSTINPVLTATTNASGEYVINLSGLDSQWNSGDTITLIASKTAEGTKTTETTIQGAGGQTVNLTLAETSDLNYASNVFNKHNLNFVLLLDYAGNKITTINPLPVTSSEIDLLNNPAHSWVITRQDGQPDTETAIIRGDTYTRTFTYNSDGMMTARSAWVKQ